MSRAGLGCKLQIFLWLTFSPSTGPGMGVWLVGPQVQCPLTLCPGHSLDPAPTLENIPATRVRHFSGGNTPWQVATRCQRPRYHINIFYCLFYSNVYISFCIRPQFTASQFSTLYLVSESFIIERVWGDSLQHRHQHVPQSKAEQSA